MKVFDNKPAVISAAVVFAIFVAAFLYFAFAVKDAETNNIIGESLAACFAAAIFTIGFLLLFLRRRWARIACSALLAIVVLDLVWAALFGIWPPPYPTRILRSGVALLAVGSVWLFIAFAFGEGARQYFTTQKPRPITSSYASSAPRS